MKTRSCFAAARAGLPEWEDGGAQGASGGRFTLIGMERKGLLLSHAFFSNLLKMTFRDGREKSIPFICSVEDSQKDGVNQLQGFLIDTLTADDKALLLLPAGVDRFGQTACDAAPWNLQLRVSAKYNIETSRQCVADGFMGFSSHDHRMAHGDLLEMRQFFRDVPGNSIVTADDSIAAHCSDKNEFHGDFTASPGKNVKKRVDLLFFLYFFYDFVLHFSSILVLLFPYRNFIQVSNQESGGCK